VAVVSDPDRKLWDRWEGEPDDAWNAFRVYRDLPPNRRQIRKVASMSFDKLCRWHREFDWFTRCQAFDEANKELFTEEVRRQYLATAAIEYARSVEEQIGDMRELWDREVAKLLERSRDSEMNMLKPTELLKLGELKFRAERLVSGQTTENVGTSDVDYDNLSSEELLQLNELMTKAIKKGAKAGSE
jgi:hypothetical protein